MNPLLTVGALTFAVNILTSLLKRYIYPKYGKIGVQIVAFVLASIGAVYFTYLRHNQVFSEIVGAALGLFSLSVTFYEVVLQYIPWFKAKKKTE